jgi:APA family basic amino acid/polyamine antiporter
MVEQQTFTREGLYVRKATGLVREVSPFSALLFNILPTVPGVGLAVSVFFALGVFPGAHIISAYWLTGLIALAIALPFAFLGTAFARSGGDYILVSRSLGPRFGLASSFSLLVAAVLATALVCTFFPSIGIVPGLQTIGLISGNHWWVQAGTTLSTKGWTLVLSFLMLFVALFLGGIRLRSAMRFQNISFAIAGLGMLAGFITMLTVSRSEFEAKFNEISGAGSYAKIIADAHKAGVGPPGTSWSNTVPVLGVLAFLFIFSWWSSHYGGEIRAARTRGALVTMTLSILAYVLIYTFMTLALFHLVGQDFLAASSAVPGSVPAFWFIFVAIGAKSTIFAIFLVVTFLFWFPMWTWLQIAQPIRAFFAWAYDGLFPRAVTTVSPRTHAPVVALALTGVLASGALIWAVYSSSFLTVISTVTLFNLTPMAFVAVSAILLPYLKPELWRQTPLARRVAGVPLLTIIGVLGLAAVVFVFYLYMHYDGLGVVHKVRTVIAMAACVVAGFSLYEVASIVQRRHGVDVDLNFGELPAE